jgi:alkylmercury lyase
MPADAGAAHLLLSVKKLAEQLLRVFPPLDDAGRTIALATYRELARGAPAAPQDVARRASVPAKEAAAALRAWPGVFFDDGGRIVGFWGLAIRSMPHRLRVGNRELYAWCAWDALFLPRVLGEDVRVESACRETGEAVRLTVGPAALKEARPPEAVLSFLTPDASAVQGDVVTGFCHHVHFFRSTDAAQQWLSGRPGMFRLSLAEGFELGRHFNAGRYGALLESDA